MSDHGRTSGHAPPGTKLEKVRAEIARASSIDGQLYNQWGDAAAELGHVPEAMGAYGRAVDAYVGENKARMAIAVCEKMVRNYPGVTRTHFTLACLNLSRGLVRESVRALAAYAAAVERSGTQAMAIPRLRFLSAVVGNDSIRSAIADLLQVLGDREGEAVARGAPPPLLERLDESERSRQLLEAATTASDALWAKYWLR